jgi:hypothetical protein
MCSVGAGEETGCFSGFCCDRPEIFKMYGCLSRKKSGIWGKNVGRVAIAGTYVHYSSVRKCVNRQNDIIKVQMCGKREPELSFFKTLLGALPPPRRHPPVAMMCQKVILHLRKAEGRFGGTGTVPSVNKDRVLYETLI